MLEVKSCDVSVELLFVAKLSVVVTKIVVVSLIELGLVIVVVKLVVGASVVVTKMSVVDIVCGVLSTVVDVDKDDVIVKGAVVSADEEISFEVVIPNVDFT